MIRLRLTVNNLTIETTVDPRTSLADFLRDQLNLTGTHLGCEHGVCGACTLLLDGAPARSCIAYAAACDGAALTTIEGLNEDEIAVELRAAFTREHALQCGYCTPGMLIAARDLVQRLTSPDERPLRIALSGNLCRCTGYVGVVRAVRSVIAARRARGITAEPDGGRKILGPVGSGHARAVVATAVKSAAASAAQSATRVEVLAIPDFTPAARFEQSFVVAHPLVRVYEFFGDIAAVASCLPGASLTATPKPERVEGAIRVRLGPIAANFVGAGRVDRDPLTLSGRIVGAGADQGSRSSTHAEIRYRLIPIEDGASTQVELTVGYSLKGPLAQIGRPGLVRDVAARIVADFARNLDNRLSGAPTATLQAASPINGFSLFVSLLMTRLTRLIRRRL